MIAPDQTKFAEEFKSNFKELKRRKISGVSAVLNDTCTEVREYQILIFLSLYQSLHLLHFYLKKDVDPYS